MSDFENMSKSDWTGNLGNGSAAMSEETKYQYRAIYIEDGRWMVRRYDDHGCMNEAEIIVDPSLNEHQVIAEAIARGSWS
jgi:hypothetical protein